MKMNPYHITIDVRMIHASGIGTYLRNILPRVIASNPEINFTLLGKSKELIEFDWSHVKNIQIINFEAPIYSISEQMGVLQKIPGKTTLFWSPHYNIPLLYRKKLLVTIHDLAHLAMPGLFGGFHKRLYAKSMFNAVRYKAAAIITDSYFTKNEFLRLTNGKKEVISPIHLGVEDAWFKIKEGKNPYGKPFILFVGNVKPHKNLENIIKAFGSIVHKTSDDLVIVGKKEGFITGDRNIFSLASKLGGRVYFAGQVTGELLKQYFAHATTFVFPSLYEGFGFPPLEAMAAGCPVIVSNVASLPEVCGNAALYCDPYNHEDIAQKILELRNNESLRETLRLKGFEQAKKFSWIQCANETNSVITRLLENVSILY